VVFSGVAFSPDGKTVVSGSKDATVRFWDVLSGQPIIFPIKCHTDRVTSFALSPDNKTIVSASLDSTVLVWDARNGVTIGLPLQCGIKGVISLAISPDGSQFAAASSDSTVCLWETESRRLLTSYKKEYINEMSFITFSSDGRHLMTSSIDGTAYTWNAIDGQPIKTPKSSDNSFLDASKALVVSTQRGRGSKEDDETFLRCYPTENPDFGHWAYIDNTLIRRDKTGLTTIMDMSEVLRKWQGRFGEQGTEERSI
jgi:WD40 repeat protein